MGDPAAPGLRERTDALAAAGADTVVLQPPGDAPDPLPLIAAIAGYPDPLGVCADIDRSPGSSLCIRTDVELDEHRPGWARPQRRNPDQLTIDAAQRSTQVSFAPPPREELTIMLPRAPPG